MSSVALSGDGRTAVSGSGTSTVRVWDLATGALLRRPQGHADWVSSVALSGDGRTAVSGESWTARCGSGTWPPAAAADASRATPAG